MTPQEAYNKRITEARTEALRQARSGESGALQQLREALRRIAEEIQASVSQGTLTAGEAEELRSRIDAALQRAEREARSIISGAKTESMRRTIEAHESAFEEAASIAGVAALPISEWAPNIRERTRTSEKVRRGVSSSVGAMIQRSLQSAADTVDDALAQAVSAGESASSAAQTVAQALSPNRDTLPTGGRQLISDLRRILVTEVSTIMDEAGKNLAALNPAVDLVRWTLSGRHSSLASSPDACDVLEAADRHDYGRGLYHPQTAPSLPHPHCECRIQTVLKPPSEWTEGNRPIPDRPSVTKAGVRELMEQVEGRRTVTDAHVRNQREMIERVVEQVFENPRGT